LILQTENVAQAGFHAFGVGFIDGKVKIFGSDHCQEHLRQDASKAYLRGMVEAVQGVSLKCVPGKLTINDPIIFLAHVITST
jgi:hypothetical protein